jgi:hypothetical protein
MRSLRTRLILTHILPLLVVIPLVGVALAYLLETQVLLAGLSNELERPSGILFPANSSLEKSPVRCSHLLLRFT